MGIVKFYAVHTNLLKVIYFKIATKGYKLGYKLQ